MAWIDFRELRDKLDFREVLRHYGVDINAKNQAQHHSRCPLPTHGSSRSPSFSANLDKRIWRCFGCSAQGNILDFACRMENLDPAKAEDIRKVALLLAERYGIKSDKPQRAKCASAPAKVAAVAHRGPAIVNAPLDFALKGLDPDHPYLKDRRFTPETIAHFELGYCARGLMQGRVAIPLRNAQGKLIGYAGRVVDDSLITAENPKYRFPSAREHDGKRFEFSKSLLLYNGHAIPSPAEELVIVEGFPATWWLRQHGFQSTVALMGATCTAEQAALIVGIVPRRGRIWVFTDGDQAGRYCAQSLLTQLAPYRFTRWIELRDDRKPTDCDPDELRDLFE